MKVLREDERSMEVEVKNLTLASLISKYLNMDERVESAAFKKEHPLKETALVYFVVKEGSPKEILLESVKKAKADVKALKEALLSSLQ